MGKLNEADARERAANPLGKEFSQALARGLAILTTFDPDSPSLTLSAVAQRVGLPRATTRRALLTLAQLGYVEERDKQFRLTPRVLRVAGAYLGSSIASTILQPLCETLAAQHGVTFSVAALDGVDAVMIAYAMPRRLYVQGAGIGLRIPAHCSAVGRVLLSGLHPDALRAFLKQLRPQALTPHTVLDKTQIAEAIDEAGRQRHAVVENEAEVGFRSLAVPLCGQDGRTRFALNVGAAIRYEEVGDLRQRYLPILKDVAADLRAQLI